MPTLQTIVVPLDGSDFSSRALPVANSIAQVGHVPLRIVGVARADDELAWIFDHVHGAARSVTNGSAPKVDIVIDPDPATVMLGLADEPGSLLCFASHDRSRVAAKVMRSVGTELMARATRPFVVVGEGVARNDRARDVVVAVDGRSDPEPLLAAAVPLAARLQCRLRIVTVFEPVPADLRRPAHYTRHHGPAGDPESYLEALRDDVARYGAPNVSTAAIPDPISPAAGLHAYLGAHPALLLVVGGRRRETHPIRGTTRALLPSVNAPMLVINGAYAHA
jgi:nucleotide-binding universal stress UspA family protein